MLESQAVNINHYCVEVGQRINFTFCSIDSCKVITFFTHLIQSNSRVYQCTVKLNKGFSTVLLALKPCLEYGVTGFLYLAFVVVEVSIYCVIFNPQEQSKAADMLGTHEPTSHHEQSP